ncbi:MAG: hypothetical protein NTW87_09520 [Planctomycetota bacterium]|nr:hypothetical protein [Planctomycetota bacterium]
MILDRRTDELKSVADTMLKPEALLRFTKVLLSTMIREHLVEPVEGAGGLYQVTAPYAERLPLDEHELAMEANPYAALSHFSALVYWNATAAVPKQTFLTSPRAWAACGIRPIGLAAGEELGLALPYPQAPEHMMRFGYVWTSVKNEWYFGFEERGWLRVMTLERTLLDGLREPQLCGGMSEVLRVFRRSRSTINLSRLVEYANTFNIRLLRQRAGFVLTRLGLAHPELAKWKRQAQRGGSSRLLAGAPFSSTYDADWSLSINCPATALEEDT